MRVAVLGAGVIGVTAAWYLARAGHEVSVVDRQSGPALETSFANGGQISVSHAQPWANPQAPAKILKWLGREDAPLLFRLRADASQWRWAIQFLIECLPSRTRRNTVQCLRLAMYSRECLQALRAETGLAYDALQRGILHYYTEAPEYESDVRAIDLLRAHGCDPVAVSPEECLAIEPALGHAGSRLVGGVYTPSDESGDAQRFTTSLAALGEQNGVRFIWDTTIEALSAATGRIAFAQCRGARGTPTRIEADAYVVALGSYSPLLLRPVGVPALVFPTKGYSVTIPVGTHAGAPTVSLTDVAFKIVMSRLGERLRVAGTAELAGYDTTLNATRCEALVRRVFEIFPDAGERENVARWTGLRPATPSNVPLVGRTRYPNLFLDTGHGTLGWTMACGSGRALADIVSDRAPEVDFAFT